MEANRTIAALTGMVNERYPHLIQDTSIQEYVFWDCKKNVEIPPKDLDAVNIYIKENKINDFALVIYFKNNTIGYRLKL